MDILIHDCLEQSVSIMILSVLGIGLVKGKATMLQTEAGYGSCADKRIEIAKHMRFILMGYFNDNSVGSITAVTTNTMQNLENVATRVVMLIMFDVRIALILFVGFVLFMVANHYLQTISEKISKEEVIADEKMIEQVIEYVQGITEVKTFHLTHDKSKALNESIERNAIINKKMEFTLVPYMGLQTLITKLTGVAMASASVLFYLEGSMSMFYELMMIISSFLVLDSLNTAGSYSALLRVVNLSVDLANHILETKPMDIDGMHVTPDTYDIRA